MRNLILLFIFPLIAIAAPSNVDKAFFGVKNLLTNPGFENGLGSWLLSGGTLAKVTSGTNLLEGSVSATWDSSGSAQVLASSPITIPKGIYNRPATAFCSILTPSGTATHTISAYDGSSTLASAVVTSNTSPVRASVTFLMPSSGTIALRIASVAADEPSITIDDCYLGSADGVSLINAKTQDVFSAFVADGAATTTVSQENVDWINGNCTNASTGVYVCTFMAGIFSVAPNCTATNAVIGSGRRFDATTTSSAVTLNVLSGAGAQADTDFFISCQKATVDSPSVAFKPDTVANSWSGYHDNTCSWARTNVAYGDPTADASCALVERTNRSFGTVSTSGSVLPAITFTPKRAGTYRVCAFPSVHIVTAGADIAIRLWDGTTTIAEQDRDGIGANQHLPLPICGNYIASSTSAVTFSLQSKATSGEVRIEALTAASSIEWSIFQIDQSFPAPLLANTVVNKYSGVTGIEVGEVNCDSGAVIVGQHGTWISSIGNISAGTCVVTLASGVFSTTPYCLLTGTTSGEIAQVTASSPTSVSVSCLTDAGANCTAFNVNMLCVGTR